MRYPKHIKKGETIGFVAPSFGCATEPYISRFNSALDKFKEMGYGLDLGPNCRASEGIGISNTPVKCGEELNEYYCSEHNQGIISCGGGEMMCEVVPYIDFDRVKSAKPKWYMGYSDNTNFVFLSATLADTAAIYAPCAGDFGMEPWHEAVGDAFDLFCGNKYTFHSYDKWQLNEDENANANDPYYVTESNIMKSYNCPEEGVSFEGRLIGGCMDCLLHLMGTPYDKVKNFNEKYKEDGIIWFLEACDLSVFGIRRTIWQMKENGWFSHLKGFLIGRPGCFGQEFLGLDQYNAVTDLLKEYNVPILMDLDIGHHPPMMPMLCGGYAKVDFFDNKLTVSYELK